MRQVSLIPAQIPVFIKKTTFAGPLTMNTFLAAFFYYLILLPVSALPYRVLYGLSDLLFFLFYRILPYRKKVVRGNIRNSFPDRSPTEQEAIVREFYRHLCDLIVESIKVFTIKADQVDQRMHFRNPEVINRFFDEGRSVVLVGGHLNNWELFAVGIARAVKHHPIAIYKPLSNRFFDRKMRQTRGKFGLEMVSIFDVKATFEKYINEPVLTIFGADQSPGKAAKAYWMEFLHQDTAVLFGTEAYANRYNHVVVYGCIHKIRRGYYETEFRVLFENPSAEPHGKVTEVHTRQLEQDIRLEPQHWLWSHRRWKHKRPANVDTGAAQS